MINEAAGSARKLPDGWRWVKLREVLTALETGSRPKGGAVGIYDGVPSISAEHMTPQGTFDFSVIRYVPREYYEKMPRGRIRRDDILIVKDGATTGKTCFVDESFPFEEAVVNEHVFICRAESKQILPQWLYFWLWGPQGQNEIKSSFQGAAIGGINQSFVEAVHIPLPSLTEQKRISFVLRKQLEAVWMANVAANVRLEASRLLVSSLLQKAFFPLRKCGRVCLAEIASRSITYGIVQSGSHFPDGVPTVRGGDIKAFRIDFEKLKRVDPSISNQYSKTILQGDEILLVIRGFPGNVAIVTPQLVGSNVAREIAVIPVSPKYSQAYIQYAIASPEVQQRIVQKTQGAAQQGINLSDVNDLEIPNIDIESQNTLVDRLHVELSNAESVELAIRKEKDSINALPAALLRRAFNGEL